MKIANEIDRILAEQFLPKNIEIGKKYESVFVDDKTFKDLILKNINTDTSELFFVGKSGKHKFNYIEQEIEIN